MEKKSLIDLKDRRILSELDMDGRMPLTTLAKKVKLSREVITYRLKRLAEKGVVVGTVPIFDPMVVGENWYRILFRFLNVTRAQKNQFISYLLSHPHIVWVGEIGGSWDLILNFTAKDNYQFNTIFEQMMKDFGAFIRDYEILIFISIYDLERQYILPSRQTSRKEFFHEMKYDPSFEFDATHKKIVQELVLDGSASNLEIAHRVGVSPNTVKNRIAQMKKHKLLLGFRLWSRPQELGRITHLLFLSITRLNLQREKELYAYLKTIPQLAFLVKHIGKWRIGLEFETTSPKEFQEIFIELRGRFSDIITDFEAMPFFKDLVINYFPLGALQ